MQAKGFWVSVVTLSMGALINVAHADNYAIQDTFLNNGSVATAFENAVDNFMLPMEVQQIGSAVYNIAENYPPATTISPYTTFNLGSTHPSSSPQADFVSAHKSSYCGSTLPIEQQNFQCQSSSSDPTTSMLLDMGDIKPSVLMEPLVYANSLQWWAAHDYIKLITMPFPSTIYANFISSPSSFSGSNTQQRSYATYMANQALLSMARYALDEMFGMRLSGTYLGVTSANNGSVNSSTLSIMEVMENEATRRFGDPNYAGSTTAFLNATTTTQQQIWADMAAMQAFQLWMQYQSYRQNERIAGLLAAMVGSNVYANIQGNIATVSGGG